ncbi:hypothetical protein EAI_01101 [Harpegnathos saltator]|uniref:Uncharacterized protein n=1 Tax=Harpegnathos saltator TaxID=610380 RepID=E2B4V9_HARSA|nr:hypothetical protein EAI_01101 [Harpegnathos saltator]
MLQPPRPPSPIASRRHVYGYHRAIAFFFLVTQGKSIMDTLGPWRAEGYVRLLLTKTLAGCLPVGPLGGESGELLPYSFSNPSAPELLGSPTPPCTAPCSTKGIQGAVSGGFVLPGKFIMDTPDPLGGSGVMPDSYRLKPLRGAYRSDRSGKSQRNYVYIPSTTRF